MVESVKASPILSGIPSATDGLIYLSKSIITSTGQ